MDINLMKPLEEGDLLPKGYGIAYRRWDRMIAVCYPFPLNWLVGLAVRAWRGSYCRSVPFSKRASALLKIEYDRGFRAGHRAGSADALYNVGYKRGLEDGRKAMGNELTEEIATVLKGRGQ